jgi:site-specific DNA-methyltransferase (adenine-specific)
MMNKNDLDVSFSAKSDEWETPLDFYQGLDSIYHFTLDPCSTSDNAKCKKFFTAKENGLEQSWKGETVFINPPYSNISDWAKKCNYEYIRNNATTVMLIPARTDTDYFHLYCMEATSYGFVHHRLCFENRSLPSWRSDGSHKKSPAPYPSILIIHDPKERGTPVTIRRYNRKGLVIPVEKTKIDLSDFFNPQSL